MKNHLVIGILVFFSVVTSIAHAVPVRWDIGSGGNGNYYELIVTNPVSFRTWSQANSAASSRTYLGVNGHLATITSQGEHDFLQTLDWTTILPSLVGAWIGGVQPSGSGEPNSDWRWVTGEVWDYTNWAPNEPNNQNEEDQLALNAPVRGGLWNDEDGATAAYIVEFDVAAVPVPPAFWLFSSGFLGLMGIARGKQRSH